MLHILKNRLVVILFATAFILGVIGLSSAENSKINWINNIVNVPLAPVEGFFSFVTSRIGDALFIFKDIKAVREENEKLKARIDELEQKNRELEFFGRQNEELRGVLALKDRYNNYTAIGGNVIARDMNNWSDVFTIDVGKNDGLDDITRNGFNNYYAVVTSKGLVGRIIEISALSSKVMSIIDEDSTVSGILTKSRQYVEVRGDLTLRAKGLCLVDNIEPNVDIGPGDTVETSGVGGGYPKGIVIGTIIEVKKAKNDFKTYAILQPSVDFRTLEIVSVLKSNFTSSEMESALP